MFLRELEYKGGLFYKAWPGVGAINNKLNMIKTKYEQTRAILDQNLSPSIFYYDGAVLKRHDNDLDGRISNGEKRTRTKELEKHYERVKDRLEHATRLSGVREWGERDTLKAKLTLISVDNRNSALFGTPSEQAEEATRIGKVVEAAAKVAEGAYVTMRGGDLIEEAPQAQALAAAGTRLLRLIAEGTRGRVVTAAQEEARRLRLMAAPAARPLDTHASAAAILRDVIEKLDVLIQKANEQVRRFPVPNPRDLRAAPRRDYRAGLHAAAVLAKVTAARTAVQANEAAVEASRTASVRADPNIDGWRPAAEVPVFP